MRTSVTHPLRIGEIPTGHAGAAIGITFCPGKRGPSNSGFLWERDLKTDLDLIAKWNAKAIVTLIEDSELQLLGVPDLGAQIRGRGIEWFHLPIVDLDVPDTRFEVQWRSIGPELVRLLRDGARVLVHCRGGLGRAGTIAARLLIELGIPPREAIKRVRTARPGAIETHQQEQYVLNLAARSGVPERGGARGLV